MLLHDKLLNLKTFKDFSFMPKSKTFNLRHLEGIVFFKDLNKNYDMMPLFLKTFKDFS